MAPSKRQSPKKRLKEAIAASPIRSAVICAIPGCGRPTLGAAAKGLSSFHCRRHVEHKARHGSHWHGTYKAADLKPYLAAATSLVRIRAGTDPAMVASVAAIRGVMEAAGPSELATRLMGMPAAKRA